MSNGSFSGYKINYFNFLTLGWTKMLGTQQKYKSEKRAYQVQNSI